MGSNVFVSEEHLATGLGWFVGVIWLALSLGQMWLMLQCTLYSFHFPGLDPKLSI